jgi:hypothetical protein
LTHSQVEKEFQTVIALAKSELEKKLVEARLELQTKRAEFQVAIFKLEKKCSVAQARTTELERTIQRQDLELEHRRKEIKTALTLAGDAINLQEATARAE